MALLYKRFFQIWIYILFDNEAFPIISDCTASFSSNKNVYYTR